MPFSIALFVLLYALQGGIQVLVEPTLNCTPCEHVAILMANRMAVCLLFLHPLVTCSEHQP